MDGYWKDHTRATHKVEIVGHTPKGHPRVQRFCSVQRPDGTVVRARGHIFTAHKDNVEEVGND